MCLQPTIALIPKVWGRQYKVESPICALVSLNEVTVEPFPSWAKGSGLKFLRPASNPARGRHTKIGRHTPWLGTNLQMRMDAVGVAHQKGKWYCHINHTGHMHHSIHAGVQDEDANLIMGFPAAFNTAMQPPILGGSSCQSGFKWKVNGMKETCLFTRGQRVCVCVCRACVCECARVRASVSWHDQRITCWSP
jgi:hypothetical protein